MTSARLRPLVAGNWKMNGLISSLAEAERMQAGYDAALQGVVDMMICPPATLLSALAQKLSGGKIQIGAQDCHMAISGAHTGDISAEMLADAGAGAVILGHSERRADHGESSTLVRQKTEAAWRAGLSAIVCIGETRAKRDAGQTLDVVSDQLAESIPDTIPDDRLIIAYEPVWAIGTGLTPTAADVAEVHGALRQQLVARFGAGQGGAIRLLYGGSVKPSNARELLSIEDVNGALVGGASLKADDFLGIMGTYGD